MREVPEIRQDINRVDSAIRELFLLRMSLALEVAKTKAQSDDKIYKPDREAEIVEKRSAGMEEELQLKYVSLPQNVPTWEQVFQSVRDGKADIGVVPVENTTAGTVSEVYDLLLDYDLYINRSYIKKISHCLAAVPGTKLEDVKRVCSHPHALPQCHSFISEHDLEAIEVANTAIAAQNVQKKGDKSLAAICSQEAAVRYGLDILAEGINDMQHNETRFIAVSKTLTCQPEDNRIEIAFHIPNASGTLITVLDTIAHYGIDMTEIHSRPLKDSPWCYVFYVDFTGNMRDHAVQSLLYQLHEELPYIKVIGSYCVPNE